MQRIIFPAFEWVDFFSFYHRGTQAIVSLVLFWQQLLVLYHSGVDGERRKIERW